ncbi:MAG: aminoacyl-tRNA hydrolase [Bacteroidia bacterium]|nr:aminoacyl-tRNA hydrolase [Bacteroidia bacterium]MDW8345540.1 aminoacyl-tRNA hydrolase [Bacteroidia bacterium]
MSHTFIIVGLGNIGNEYKDTRHNVGFMAVDKLAEQKEVKFILNRYAYTAEFKHKGRLFILVKPTTYMNLSGKAVNYYVQEENIPLSNLLIITDDIALPLGKIRIRKKGSDGGHNGLKNIQDALNTQEYARVRIGIGNNFPKGKQADYVLAPFDEEEIPIIQKTLDIMPELILNFGLLEIDKLMNLYNK